MLQIHQKIERARVSAGLTQEEIALKLGINRSTYKYWEEKTPSIDKIKRVAEVLELPLDYFLTNEGEKPAAARQNPNRDEDLIQLQKKHIAFLEKELSDKDEQIKQLSMLLNSSVAELQKQAKTNRAFLKTQFHAQNRLIAFVEKKPIEKIRSDMDMLLSESLEGAS